MTPHRWRTLCNSYPPRTYRSRLVCWGDMAKSRCRASPDECQGIYLYRSLASRDHTSAYSQPTPARPKIGDHHLSLSQPSTSSCQALCVGKQTNAITRPRSSASSRSRARQQQSAGAKQCELTDMEREHEVIEIVHARSLSAR